MNSFSTKKGRHFANNDPTSVERKHNSSFASRRSSEEPNEISFPDVRDLKQKVTELEEKFSQTMVNNAQLDKEKQCYSYQIETLKDELQELEEHNYRLLKEFKEKSRNYDFLCRDFSKLEEENSCLKECLRLKDRIIEENGLVLITSGEGDERDERDVRKPMVNGDVDRLTVLCSGSLNSSTAALITQEAKCILEELEGETFEEKLRFISKEKRDLLEQIKQLKNELEEERQRNKDESYNSQLMNGIEPKLNEIESSKLIHEYKFRLMEAEQERNNLQNIIMRLETQLERLRQNAEQSEKLENDLKTEKRKVLRELREAQARIEDLETSNAHLQKRIDKFKSKCLATINSN